MEKVMLTREEYKEIGEEVGAQRDREAARRNRILVGGIMLGQLLLALAAYLGGRAAS